MTCFKTRTIIIAQGLWQWMSWKFLADFPLQYSTARLLSPRRPPCPSLLAHDAHVRSPSGPWSVISCSSIPLTLTNDSRKVSHPSLSSLHPNTRSYTLQLIPNIRCEKFTKYTLVKMLIVFYCTSFHGNSCPTTKYVLLHLTTPLQKCNVMTGSN